MAGRLFFFAVALAAFLGMLLAFAGHGEARCKLECVREQVRTLRQRKLPLRVRRLEQRLEKQDLYISWLEERAAREEAKAQDLGSRLTEFQRCFGEIPLTRYGQETGPSGYVFQIDGEEGATSFPTTALDLSYPGDSVGAWIWINPCNSDRITPKSSLLPTP